MKRREGWVDRGGGQKNSDDPHEDKEDLSIFNISYTRAHTHIHTYTSHTSFHARFCSYIIDEGTRARELQLYIYIYITYIYIYVIAILYNITSRESLLFSLLIFFFFLGWTRATSLIEFVRLYPATLVIRSDMPVGVGRFSVPFATVRALEPRLLPTLVSEMGQHVRLLAERAATPRAKVSLNLIRLIRPRLPRRLLRVSCKRQADHRPGK